MATIQVDIVSAEGEIHTGEAAMVFAPASMGEVGIAPRHAPMLTKLKPGEVRVQTQEETLHCTMFFDYINQRNGRVLQEKIEAPSVPWDSPAAAGAQA